MGKTITNDVFYCVKKLLKDKATTKEAAERVGISTDSVCKIRSVATYSAYLRRYVYPKRQGGKSYESYKHDAQRWHNYAKEPVNGREEELAKQKETVKTSKKYFATNTPEVYEMRLTMRNDWKMVAVVAVVITIILLTAITVIEGIMIADLWKVAYGTI